MARSLDQIADELGPGPEREAFRYLARRSDGYRGDYGASGAQIADNTRLVQIAVNELIRWAMAGVREADNAFKQAVGKLPRGKFNVFIARSELDKMQRWVSDLARNLDRSIKDANDELRHYGHGGTPGNMGKQHHLDVIAMLQKRKGELRQLESDLRFFDMMPADPGDSTKWLRT